MANENCLVGMACPECGSLGPFNIETTAVVTWTDDGTTDLIEPEFGPDNYIDCLECGHDGIVDDFKIKAGDRA